MDLIYIFIFTILSFPIISEFSFFFIILSQSSQQFIKKKSISLFRSRRSFWLLLQMEGRAGACFKGRFLHDPPRSSFVPLWKQRTFVPLFLQHRWKQRTFLQPLGILVVLMFLIALNGVDCPLNFYGPSMFSQFG